MMLLLGYHLGYHLLTPYLLRRPSGLFVRFLVPVDLRPLLGKRYLLRKLPAHLPEARLVSAWLGLALSRVFALKREGVDVDLKKALEAAQRAVEFKGKNVRLPNGVEFGELEIGSAEDAKLFKESFGVGIESIGMMPVAPSLPAIPLNSPRLSDQIKIYIEDMKRANRSIKGVEESRFSLELFQGLVGDKRVLEVGASDVRAFMNALERYPSNASKNKEFDGLTPKEILALAENGNYETLGPRTKAKHFEKIRAFFNACVLEELMEKNPTAVVPLQNKDAIQAESKRAFTQEQLNAILGSTWPNWSSKKPHRRWGVLLALFSGARVNEIAQLFVSDIEQVAGVWGFHVRVNDQTQRVKNKSSKRFVPIAKRLEDLGFFDYWRTLPSDSRLFPDLPFSQMNGYGDALSDQFTRYLKQIGVKRSKADKVGFHCWRHTFITRCSSELGLNETMIGTVSGHAISGAGGMSNYLQKSSIEQASEVVEKHALFYQDFDL